MKSSMQERKHEFLTDIKGFHQSGVYMPHLAKEETSSLTIQTIQIPVLKHWYAKCMFIFIFTKSECPEWRWAHS